MLMVIQFVSKEINCFLPLLKSCKNGVIDFLRQGDDMFIPNKKNKGTRIVKGWSYLRMSRFVSESTVPWRCRFRAYSKAYDAVCNNK